MESKDFQELVNKTKLSSKERAYVWNLFKTEENSNHRSTLPNGIVEGE